VLTVDGLETFYGVSQALFSVTLEVREREVVTLLGRNGMGKTTTVHSITGIVPARSGRIEFEGRRIEKARSFRIGQAGIALVPEGRQVFPNLTVRENLVATAANRHGRADPWTLTRILDMFPPLADRFHAMGSLLSGGEQQMLAIGRALMTNPKLLILDEATEGLAPLVRHEIWRCLERLKADGQSILVIDKNIADLARVADRHYIIEKGAIVWAGTTRELQSDPELLAERIGV